jgi:hypothetical protein
MRRFSVPTYLANSLETSKTRTVGSDSSPQPNWSLQLTPKSVTTFACAKVPPLSAAAELWR